MSSEKTVFVRVVRDFQVRVYPGEEIFMTAAQSELRLESGEVELIDDSDSDETSEEAESDSEDN